MGVMISLVIADVALIATGVLSSVGASKSSGEGLKYSAISASISFIAFIVSLAITIFLL